MKQDDTLPLPDDGPMVSGGYAEDADSGFQSAHFALWGRQAAQTKEEIKKMVTDYQPTHLLVLLGFNDLGVSIFSKKITLTIERTDVIPFLFTNTKTNSVVLSGSSPALMVPLPALSLSSTMLVLRIRTLKLSLVTSYNGRPSAAVQICLRLPMSITHY